MVTKHRLIDLWRALAVQESRALRELVRAYGRIPPTRPLVLPIVEQARLREILNGHSSIDRAYGPFAEFDGRTCEPITGTPSGYQRHRRNKEQACEPCLEAHRAKRAAYRAKMREARNAEQT